MNKNSLYDEIAQDVIEMCMVKGVVMKSSADLDKHDYIHLPLALIPTPYPVNQYNMAKQLQPHLGILLANLVKQPQYIHQILEYYQKNDPFVEKLLEISTAYNSLPTERRQDIQLLILRSDYMIDSTSNSLKMVEFNTIAAGLSSLSQKVFEIQNYVLDKYEDELMLNYEKEYIAEDTDKVGTKAVQEIGRIFKNSIDLYLQSMKEKFGGKYNDSSSKDIWIIIIVDNIERNLGDQKYKELIAYESYGLRCMRMTLEQLSHHYTIDSDTNALYVKGKEIGFVYFRNGYSLEQYKCERCWSARLIIETTMPIKCPSIDIHLTTFKKFQECFRDEKLLYDIMGEEHKEHADKIKHLFKGIWSLENIDQDDNNELKEAIQHAIENPQNYVMKPQKEGGGNNFFNEKVKEMLLENNQEYLKHFILMERIRAPEVKAFMLSQGKFKIEQSISELGIFSSVFINTKEKEPLENQTFGRLFRTKTAKSDEGGVICGHSVVDNPFLVIHDDASEPIKPLVGDI